MVWKPHVTVAAVIENKGRFLLIEEQVDGKIVINQPAGHLDEGEDLISAVIRETREETAYDFLPRYITGLYHWQNPANNETFMRVGFYGVTTGHDPSASLDTGIIRTIWLSRNELLVQEKSLRSPLVLACIDDYLAGNKHALALIRNI